MVTQRCPVLVDFTVENFRSIREPVTLSLVEVSPRKVRQQGQKRKRAVPTDDQISPALDVPGWDMRLLRAAGIFGANASGKSNVIRALAHLIDALTLGRDDQPEGDPWQPFLLDSASPQSQSTFQLRVAGPWAEGIGIWTYRLSLGGDSIGEEVLLLDSPGAEQRELFARSPHPELTRFDARLPNAVADAERTLAPRVPLIRYVAKTMNIGAFSGFVTWLRKAYVEMDEGAVQAAYASRVLAQRMPGLTDKMLELLRRFDTGISRLSLSEEDNRRRVRVLVHHDGPNGETQWDLEQESAGTQRLFSLSGPVLIGLASGGLTVIDEFGANLHPHITRRIVEMFQSPETNPKGAQLIFNSQDATLLANQLLRRDQVWYTQKRPDGSTELYPLSDFKPRNDLAIDLAYLDGRFGAVPFLAIEGGHL